jgi:hypothetical protein
LHELNEGIVLKIVDAIWSDEEIQRKIGIWPSIETKITYALGGWQDILNCKLREING